MKTTLILTLLLFPLISLSQDFSLDKDSGKALPNYIGQVKLVKGEIFKKVKGELTSIGIGARFYPKDILVTGEESFVRVQLVDDSILGLGAKSELEFSEFLFKDKNDRKGTFNLIKGQLRSLIKNKVKGEELVFKTKYAVMGVRGTELLVNHRQVKRWEISEFALLEGSAEVHKDGEEGVMMKPGSRMIYVQDPVKNMVAHDLRELTEEEKKNLTKAINEEKEIAPVMPYFEPETMTKTDKLFPVFEAKEQTALKASDVTPRPHAPHKNWRENLRKLNEKLKQNHQDGTR
jgi:hypothetical protein